MCLRFSTNQASNSSDCCKLFLGYKNDFFKNRNSTLKWNVAKQFQLTVEWLVSCPEKMIIRKRWGVLLLKNLSRSYPVEVDTISSLFLNPYVSIALTTHEERVMGGFGIWLPYQGTGPLVLDNLFLFYFSNEVLYLKTTFVKRSVAYHLNPHLHICIYILILGSSYYSTMIPTE